MSVHFDVQIDEPLQTEAAVLGHEVDHGTDAGGERFLHVDLLLQD